MRLLEFAVSALVLVVVIVVGIWLVISVPWGALALFIVIALFFTLRPRRR